MTDHEILSENVRVVTYDNGVVIYINTGTEDENVNGITIPARSYVRGGVK